MRLLTLAAPLGRLALAAVVASALPALAAAAPAMVTTTRGTVKLVDGASTGPAPAAPFLLDEDAKLELADGAEAVVLADGTAKRFTGPRAVTRADLAAGGAVQGSGKAASLLDDLLSVQHSQATAGAHRGGLALVRPIPGGDVLALHTIRWTCAGCGPQTVEVVDFLEGETLWTGSGTGSVTYTGPAITADSVQIAVGGERFTVHLAGAGKRSTLEQAKQAAEAPMGVLRAQGDEVGAASVLVGLFAHIGLESDALALAEDLAAKHPNQAGFAALVADIERRALPRP